MTDPKKPTNPAANRRRQRQRELEEKLKQRMAPATASEDEATAMLSVEDFVEQAKSAPIPNDQEETPLSVMPPNELEWADQHSDSEATAMLDISANVPEPVPEPASPPSPAAPPDPSDNAEEATVMMSEDVVQDVIAAVDSAKGVEKTGEHTSQLLAAAEVLSNSPARESTDMLPSADEVLEPSAVLKAMVSSDDGEDVVDFPLEFLEEEPEEATQMRPARDAEVQPVGDDATRMNLPVVQEREREGPLSSPIPTGATALKSVLSVLAGPDINQRFLIGHGVTFVGRSHDCQVVLHDLATSRQHFRIECDGEDARLIDMGSENGTLVNGQAVHEHLLVRGDRIIIGGTELYFSHPDDPIPASDESNTASRDGDNIWVLMGIIAAIALGLAVVTVGAGQWAGWWNVLGEDAPKLSESAAAEESDEEETTEDESTDSEASDNAAEASDDEEDPAEDTEKDPEVNVASEETEEDAEPADAPAAPSATTLLQQAKTKLNNGELADAIASLEAARVAGGDASALDALSERIVQAKEDQQLMESLRTALTEKRWADGLALAERLHNDSVFESDAKKLVAQLTSGQVTGLLEKAKAHVASAEWEKAQQAVENVLQLSPDDPQAQRMLETIAEAKSSAAPAADDSKAPEAIPVETVSDEVSDAPNRPSPEDPPVESPAPVVADTAVEAVTPTFATGPVYRAYSNGDFSGARRRCLRAAKDESLPEAERARAQKMARHIRTFEKEFSAAMSASHGGNPGASVGAYKRALRADRGVNRSYQRKVKSALGKAYGVIAVRAERGGRNYEAVKAARDALKYTSGQADATRVLGTVDGRVSGMIAQAKAGIEAGRRGRAKRKLKEVLLILKVLKKRDGRTAQVKRLLDSL